MTLPRRISTRLLVLAFVLFAMSIALTACASRKPTLAEERQIWAAIANYHNAVFVDGRLIRHLAATGPSTAPATQPRQDRTEIWPEQIEIHGSSASAKFELHRTDSQFFSWPQRAVLVYENDKWIVRESRGNTSLIFDVANHTVGVK